MLAALGDPCRAAATKCSTRLTMPPTKQARPCTKLPSLSEMASCTNSKHFEMSQSPCKWLAGIGRSMPVSAALQQVCDDVQQACLVGVSVLTQRVQQVGGGGAGVEERHVLREEKADEQGRSWVWGLQGSAA